MDEDPNEIVQRALDVARELNMFEDRSEEKVTDDGCAVVCCVIRDCAHKIRGLAEREQDAHRRRGILR